jgi:dienelactone hydrolase
MGSLDRYDETTFAHDDKQRIVYRRGKGPAVIVIAEMPGITPKVIDFADRVVDLGCSVALPHLFGDPGRDAYKDGMGRAAPYVLASIVPACISREFHVLAARKTSPVIDWLKALARHMHQECGGAGVGVVGMCFTGGFALAMMAEPAVLAPVLAQPSLPFSVGKRRRRSIDISDADLDTAKARCAAEGLVVLGLRFTSDPLVPAERFDFLREQLGDHFVAVEIDSSKGNPYGNPTNAHSVLTEHLIDEPSSPTRDALEAVLELYRSKLLT